jgi:hypothetical protein
LLLRFPGNIGQEKLPLPIDQKTLLGFGIYAKNFGISYSIINKTIGMAHYVFRDVLELVELIIIRYFLFSFFVGRWPWQVLPDNKPTLCLGWGNSAT